MKLAAQHMPCTFSRFCVGVELRSPRGRAPRDSEYTARPPQLSGCERVARKVGRAHRARERCPCGAFFASLRGFV
eukprot:5001927-Pyramimonas_sp.AAC.2